MIDRVNCIGANGIARDGAITITVAVETRGIHAPKPPPLLEQRSSPSRRFSSFSSEPGYRISSSRTWSTLVADPCCSFDLPENGHDNTDVLIIDAMKIGGSKWSHYDSDPRIREGLDGQGNRFNADLKFRGKFMKFVGKFRTSLSLSLDGEFRYVR